MLKISIVGCGWIGLPLAQFLKEKGYWVKGSVTSRKKMEELQALGIQGFELIFDPKKRSPQNTDDFFDTDILIILLTPQESKNGLYFHAEQMQNILNSFESGSYPKVIYTGSTSIYPENLQVADEKSEIDELTAVYQAEQVLKKSLNQQLTILRLGGLMGYDRIPAKYFSGKKGLNTAEYPVNYVHRDDVIGAIYHLIQNNIWGETLNVTAPLHPPRREIYAKNCLDFGYQMPTFVPNSNPKYKIVESNRLIKEFNYSFQFPNPLEFFYTPPQN
jgi:nucleoside-diphosphate-sugar epimerase